MSLNLMFLSAMVLVQVAWLPIGSARSIPLATQERSSSKATSEGPQHNDTSRAANHLAQLQDTSGKMQAPGILRHVVRRRDVSIPFGYDTIHLPCDMDMTPKNLERLMSDLPNHCIWAFNNRYVSEGSFRIFKMYQLEAFMFGQYHERLKRFEMDPHTWNYANIVS